MKRFSKTPVLLKHCGKLRTIITCLLTPNNTISNSIIPSFTIPHIIHFPLISSVQLTHPVMSLYNGHLRRPVITREQCSSMCV